MTEYFLALIPDYGLYAVFGCVFFACLAIPLPSSMLVFAAGGFAAAGDLSYSQVFLVTFTAYVLGDQFAFALAKRVGEPLLKRARSVRRMAKMVDKSESLVAEYGLSAVLLSHTVLSPTAPYVSYICGANAMSWRAFSLAASCGTLLWTMTLTSIGYYFSSRLSQLSDMLVNLSLVIAALTVSVIVVKWLRVKWQDF